jgi:hypothetical protein
MRDKLNQSEEREGEVRKGGPIEPTGVSEVFRPKGVYDGKILHSGTKVTYTFLDDAEVISLHFDKTRRAIYYQGHRIDNLKLTEKHIQHVENFRRALEKNPETEGFTSTFTKVWHDYLVDNAQNTSL